MSFLQKTQRAQRGELPLDNRRDDNDATHQKNKPKRMIPIGSRYYFHHTPIGNNGK